jgi:hypothetical protein
MYFEKNDFSLIKYLNYICYTVLCKFTVYGSIDTPIYTDCVLRLHRFSTLRQLRPIIIIIIGYF